MDTGIIIALILGVASIVSSICFGLVPTIRKEKLEKKDNKIQRLLKDVKSFHTIEEELLKELEKHGYNLENTKKSIRKIVSDKLGYQLSHETKPSEYNKQIK